MIRDKFINHNNSKLHYAVAGKGTRHMLIFHGFGQDLNVFEYLSGSLSPHYTFYIFDLFFHGKSEWGHDETTLEKAHWREFIDIFLKENNIQTFSLAGYSLGGKFVLSTLEAFADRTREVFLIAPDGIKTSFWYSLATYPVMLRRLFRSMVLKPERFLWLAKTLHKTGLVDNGLIRFAEYQMNTEEKRKRVYYSWVVFRHLTFNHDRIASLLNQSNIKFTLIVGKFDKVISPSNMRAFLKKIKRFRFEILETGHSGLINHSIPYFKENLGDLKI